ncbi:hypothetical protein ABIA69_001508 [Lysinibacillus parviboronicapiens]|uniref:Uncharacterized protein n=1 Tax=Lysinibacillus parviboronicapiens TaxID=436516 RepID=A0ABV2PHS3_9BACI|nr:hypothetical protein [Lysinibacillus parviboronicapiens]
MWGILVSYFPEWKVFMQGFIVFFIPYIISRVFNWISTSKED